MLIQNDCMKTNTIFSISDSKMPYWSNSSIQLYNSLIYKAFYIQIPRDSWIFQTLRTKNFIWNTKYPHGCWAGKEKRISNCSRITTANGYPCKSRSLPMPEFLPDFIGTPDPPFSLFVSFVQQRERRFFCFLFSFFPFSLFLVFSSGPVYCVGALGGEGIDSSISCKMNSECKSLPMSLRIKV